MSDGETLPYTALEYHSSHARTRSTFSRISDIDMNPSNIVHKELTTPRGNVGVISMITLVSICSNVVQRHR